MWDCTYELPRLRQLFAIKPPPPSPLPLQAIEAKEGLPIQNETVTLASISYQNFFRSFPKLAGMTGTALTEQEEFKTIYRLEVQAVPPNRTVMREDNTDVVMRTEEGKWKVGHAAIPLAPDAPTRCMAEELVCIVAAPHCLNPRCDTDTSCVMALLSPHYIGCTNQITFCTSCCAVA